MRRFRLKTIIMSVTLITVIGVMGVGYAKWGEDFRMLGNVSTGKADVSFSMSESLIEKEITYVTNAYGEVRLPFTIYNRGTVPMHLDYKSDEIELEADELLPDEEIVGALITIVPDGSSVEQFSGFIRMSTINNNWSQTLDIIATVTADVPPPIAKPKKKKVEGANSEPAEKTMNEAIEEPINETVVDPAPETTVEPVEAPTDETTTDTVDETTVESSEPGTEPITEATSEINDVPPTDTEEDATTVEP